MEQYIEVTFIIQPEDGQYSAICQELGTASCGDTVEEATANLREAVALHLETLNSLGEGLSFLKEHGISAKPLQSRPTLVREFQLPSFESFVTKNSIPVGI